jgi:hypothetical protein
MGVTKLRELQSYWNYEVTGITKLRELQCYKMKREKNYSKFERKCEFQSYASYEVTQVTKLRRLQSFTSYNATQSPKKRQLILVPKLR